MAEKMVRKRFFLSQYQDRLPKRLSRQRGVSEATVICLASVREAGTSDANHRLSAE
jgi:hypothetical protein